MKNILSLQNHLAYKQVLEDYDNLAIHLEDYRYSQFEKSKQNCLKYINRIIENKTVLKVNTFEDELLRDGL